MDNAAHILGGYGALIGFVGAYAVRLLLRGRQLSAQVPAGDRRWIDSDNQPPAEDD